MYTIFEPRNLDYFYEIQSADNIEKIILLNQTEFEFNSFGPNITFKDLSDLANSKNIKLIIIINGFEVDNYYNIDYADNLYKNIEKIEYWPTYCFTWMTDLYHTNRIIDLDGNISENFNKDFDFLFVSLAHKSHNHRIIFYDYLYPNNNLWNKGAKSLLQYDNKSIVPENWAPCIMSLTERSTIFSNHLMVPTEYDRAFVDIVLETTPNIIFLTEKVSKPLLLGKLFLVLGAKRFHKRLEELGFELYYELFDYSFDDETSLNFRIEGIIENLKKYQNHSRDDLKILFQSVEEKVNRNRKTMINLSTDVRLFPDTIKLICREFPNLLLDSGIVNYYNKYKIQ